MKQILDTFSEGTNNVRMDSNFLLWQSQEGAALTWMDAIIDGEPVTRRNGYAVELNALWFNAVMFYRELATLACQDGGTNLPPSFQNISNRLFGPRKRVTLPIVYME